jgi:hypothetical protein
MRVGQTQQGLAHVAAAGRRHGRGGQRGRGEDEDGYRGEIVPGERMSMREQPERAQPPQPGQSRDTVGDHPHQQSGDQDRGTRTGGGAPVRQ